MAIRIAYIGAGSETFGPPVVENVIGNELFRKEGLDFVLMDIQEGHLTGILAHARDLTARYGDTVTVTGTTVLREALQNADFVICAIEIERYYYWAQDYHIPRQYGFDQVYGENGEIGGIFHALRNMGPMLEIARAMEKHCPDALLLNFSNPEHKLCEAITRLTSIEVIGLCPGVFLGRQQIADILDRKVETLETAACGINHFTWFQKITDRDTGEDLYPLLRDRDASGDLLSRWHEIGLGRILFRRYGLWPSPAANHYAEYLQWSKEYVANDLQYFYDPGEGSPWKGGKVPEFVYSVERVAPDRPWVPQAKKKVHGEDEGMDVDAIGATMAVMIIEGRFFNLERHLHSVNVPNKGSIPGMPDDMVVEVPANVSGAGIMPVQMDPMPEAIAATMRLHGSIHRLIVEAYRHNSRDLLLQAILLDPTVTSYRRAVEMMNHMLELQKDRLPPLAGLSTR
jgi:alpha-galactosidase